MFRAFTEQIGVAAAVCTGILAVSGSYLFQVTDHLVCGVSCFYSYQYLLTSATRTQNS
jgi:hypothetical protein